MNNKKMFTHKCVLCDRQAKVKIKYRRDDNDTGRMFSCMEHNEYLTKAVTEDLGYLVIFHRPLE